MTAFNSVWDALVDNKQEAANMKFRSSVMSGIQTYLKSRQLTQVEAAKACGITQPRLNDLMQGKIAKFSADALVNIAATAGLRIEITIKEGL